MISSRQWTFKSFLAASVFLHGLFLGAFTVNYHDLFPQKKASPPVTIRSRARTSQPQTKKPATPTTTKPAQKVKAVLSPDAPEAPPQPVEQEQPSGPYDPNAVYSDGASGEGGSDLSSEASLLTNTLKKPEYTKEALKARIQGLFAVDIHVDDKGNVLEVEIVQSPGYGMDERIVESLKNAKFSPKKNAQGKGLETWVTIQFKLEIP